MVSVLRTLNFNGSIVSTPNMSRLAGIIIQAVGDISLTQHQLGEQLTAPSTVKVFQENGNPFASHVVYQVYNLLCTYMADELNLLANELIEVPQLLQKAAEIRDNVLTPCAHDCVFCNFLKAAKSFEGNYLTRVISEKLAHSLVTRGLLAKVDIAATNVKPIANDPAMVQCKGADEFYPSNIVPSEGVYKLNVAQSITAPVGRSELDHSISESTVGECVSLEVLAKAYFDRSQITPTQHDFMSGYGSAGVWTAYPKRYSSSHHLMKRLGLHNYLKGIKSTGNSLLVQGDFSVAPADRDVTYSPANFDTAVTNVGYQHTYLYGQLPGANTAAFVERNIPIHKKVSKPQGLASLVAGKEHINADELTGFNALMNAANRFGNIQPNDLFSYSKRVKSMSEYDSHHAFLIRTFHSLMDALVVTACAVTPTVAGAVDGIANFAAAQTNVNNSWYDSNTQMQAISQIADITRIVNLNYTTSINELAWWAYVIFASRNNNYAAPRNFTSNAVNLPQMQGLLTYPVDNFVVVSNVPWAAVHARLGQLTDFAAPGNAGVNSAYPIFYNPTSIMRCILRYCTAHEIIPQFNELFSILPELYCATDDFCLIQLPPPNHVQDAEYAVDWGRAGLTMDESLIDSYISRDISSACHLIAARFSYDHHMIAADSIHQALYFLTIHRSNPTAAYNYIANEHTQWLRTFVAKHFMNSAYQGSYHDEAVYGWLVSALIDRDVTLLAYCHGTLYSDMNAAVNGQGVVVNANRLALFTVPKVAYPSTYMNAFASVSMDAWRVQRDFIHNAMNNLPSYVSHWLGASGLSTYGNGVYITPGSLTQRMGIRFQIVPFAPAGEVAVQIRAVKAATMNRFEREGIKMIKILFLGTYIQQNAAIANDPAYYLGRGPPKQGDDQQAQDPITALRNAKANRRLVASINVNESRQAPFQSNFERGAMLVQSGALDALVANRAARGYEVLEATESAQAAKIQGVKSSPKPSQAPAIPKPTITPAVRAPKPIQKKAIDPKVQDEFKEEKKAPSPAKPIPIKPVILKDPIAPKPQIQPSQPAVKPTLPQPTQPISLPTQKVSNKDQEKDLFVRLVTEMCTPFFNMADSKQQIADKFIAKMTSLVGQVSDIRESHNLLDQERSSIADALSNFREQLSHTEESLRDAKHALQKAEAARVRIVGQYNEVNQAYTKTKKESEVLAGQYQSLLIANQKNAVDVKQIKSELQRANRQVEQLLNTVREQANEIESLQGAHLQDEVNSKMTALLKSFIQQTPASLPQPPIITEPPQLPQPSQLANQLIQDLNEWADDVSDGSSDHGDVHYDVEQGYYTDDFEGDDPRCAEHELRSEPGADDSRFDTSSSRDVYSDAEDRQPDESQPQGSHSVHDSDHEEQKDEQDPTQPESDIRASEDYYQPVATSESVMQKVYEEADPGFGSSSPNRIHHPEDHDQTQQPSVVQSENYHSLFSRTHDPNGIPQMTLRITTTQVNPASDPALSQCRGLIATYDSATTGTYHVTIPPLQVTGQPQALMLQLLNSREISGRSIADAWEMDRFYQTTSLVPISVSDPSQGRARLEHFYNMLPASEVNPSMVQLQPENLNARTIAARYVIRYASHSGSDNELTPYEKNYISYQRQIQPKIRALYSSFEEDFSRNRLRGDNYCGYKSVEALLPKSKCKLGFDPTQVQVADFKANVLSKYLSYMVNKLGGNKPGGRMLDIESDIHEWGMMPWEVLSYACWRAPNTRWVIYRPPSTSLLTDLVESEIYQSYCAHAYRLCPNSDGVIPSPEDLPVRVIIQRPDYSHYEPLILDNVMNPNHNCYFLQASKYVQSCKTVVLTDMSYTIYQIGFARPGGHLELSVPNPAMILGKGTRIEPTKSQLLTADDLRNLTLRSNATKSAHISDSALRIMLDYLRQLLKSEDDEEDEELETPSALYGHISSREYDEQELLPFNGTIGDKKAGINAFKLYKRLYASRESLPDGQKTLIVIAAILSVAILLNSRLLRRHPDNDSYSSLYKKLDPDAYYNNQYVTAIMLYMSRVHTHNTYHCLVKVNFFETVGFLPRLKEMHTQVRTYMEFDGQRLNYEEVSMLMYFYCFVGRPTGEADWDAEMKLRTSGWKVHNVQLQDGTVRELTPVELEGYVQDAIDKLVTPSDIKPVQTFTDYMDNAYTWLANGAVSGVDDGADYKATMKDALKSDVADDVRVINKKKRAYMAMMGLWDLDRLVRSADGYKNVVKTHTKQNEYGKVRSLFAADMRSYLAFSYMIHPIESAIRSEATLLNATTLENLRTHEMLRHHAMALTPFTSYDFDDFNSLHNIDDQALVVKKLYQTVLKYKTAPPEYDDVYDWCYNSFWHMHVQADDVKGVKPYVINRGLCSGHRLTTVINTVLNYTYCSIILDSMQYNLEYVPKPIVRIHYGDDVVLGFQALEECRLFNTIGIQLGYDAQLSKLMADYGRCELLRGTFTPEGDVLYSMNRVISGFVCGNWETKDVTSPDEKNMSMHDSLASMMRRGMSSQVVSVLQLDLVNYNREKLGAGKVAESYIYSTKMMHGMGLFLPAMPVYEGQQFKVDIRTSSGNGILTDVAVDRVVNGQFVGKHIEHVANAGIFAGIKMTPENSLKYSSDVANTVIGTAVDLLTVERQTITGHGKLVKVQASGGSVPMDMELMRRSRCEMVVQARVGATPALNYKDTTRDDYFRAFTNAEYQRQSLDSAKAYLTKPQYRVAKIVAKSKCDPKAWRYVSSMYWGDDVFRGTLCPLFAKYIKVMSTVIATDPEIWWRTIVTYDNLTALIGPAAHYKS